MKSKRIILLVVTLATLSLTSHGFSFNLDSIAEMGRFPRFVVNTYRWGDQFFNGFDTTYVKPTGYKFNVKAVTDNWVDYYNFDLPNNIRMRLLSDPSTSVGMRLTYLAVSAGYDKNVSHLFGNSSEAREHYTFGFNCSLFTFNMYYINNDVGTRISKFGVRGKTFNPHIDFNGMHSTSFGFDLFYFFKHKRYSQAAAFAFGRIQVKSGGSWLAGLSYSNQNFNFDFSSLPEYMKATFPSSWVDYRYHAKSRNFAIKTGYAYNWVFAPKWVLGISESPTIGLKKGFINSDTEKTTFALSNQLKMSLVWNHRQWFAGIVGEVNLGIIYDKDSTFENATINGTLSVGYRFNLW